MLSRDIILGGGGVQSHDIILRGGAVSRHHFEGGCSLVTSFWGGVQSLDIIGGAVWQHHFGGGGGAVS